VSVQLIRLEICLCSNAQIITIICTHISVSTARSSRVRLDTISVDRGKKRTSATHTAVRDDFRSTKQWGFLQLEEKKKIKPYCCRLGRISHRFFRFVYDSLLLLVLCFQLKMSTTKMKALTFFFEEYKIRYELFTIFDGRGRRGVGFSWTTVTRVENKTKRSRTTGPPAAVYRSWPSRGFRVFFGRDVCRRAGNDNDVRVVSRNRSSRRPLLLRSHSAPAITRPPTRLPPSENTPRRWFWFLTDTVSQDIPSLGVKTKNRKSQIARSGLGT